MVADSDIAFRVSGIPRSLSKEQIRHLVEEALDIAKNSRVDIHSLAFSPARHEERVCTLSFSILPQRLRKQREATVSTSNRLSLAFNTHFEGFTPLHSSVDEQCTTDIVAISGLNGHAFGSFKQKDGSHMWLRDSLPTDCRSARIFTYGYDTRAPSAQNIYDIAHTFVLLLRGIRDATSPTRQLVFICHSLGGIVVKAAIKLLAESEEEADRAHLASLRGILFFGVPSQGMRIDSLIQMTDESARRALLYSLDDENSPTMVELSESFMNAMQSCEHCEACYFYETMKSPTVIKVDGKWTMEGPLELLVSPYSATQGVLRQSRRHRVIPVNRSHSDLVKFKGRNDDVYGLTLQCLSSILSRPQAVTRQRFYNKLSLEQRRCLQSLSYREQDWREHHDSIKASEGTCGWIPEHTKFHIWMNQPRTLLWIMGAPGAGKSTLMRYLAEDRRKHAGSKSKEVIATFFVHGRGSEIQRSPLGLYRSLLQQILPHFPGLLVDLAEKYVERNELRGTFDEKWNWSEGELRDFFISSIIQACRQRPLTIFVDALDELGQECATKIISEFERLLHTDKSIPVPGDLKVCFSCRHYPILIGKRMLSVSVEKENTEDIQKLVNNSRALHQLSDADRDTIKKLISQKANGIFQWVSLTLDQVADLCRYGKPQSAIIAKINEIPSSLQGLYESLLSDHQDKKQAIKFFQWLLFTIQPLTCVQLRDALAMDADAPFDSVDQLRKIGGAS